MSTFKFTARGTIHGAGFACRGSVTAPDAFAATASAIEVVKKAFGATPTKVDVRQIAKPKAKA